MTAPPGPWTEPCDHPTEGAPPTRHDLRQHEMWDLRGQGPGPVALWTARTITNEEYL